MKGALPTTPSIFPTALCTSLPQLQPHWYPMDVTHQQHKSSLSGWPLSRRLWGLRSPGSSHSAGSLLWPTSHLTSSLAGESLQLDMPGQPQPLLGIGVLSVQEHRDVRASSPTVGCPPSQEEFWRCVVVWLSLDARCPPKPLYHSSPQPDRREKI